MLYPAPLRDFLMELAAGGLFRAKWTDEIHDEWIRNLAQDRPDIPLTALHRTRDLMNAAVSDCLVADYGELVQCLKLPDENDRHVLAAAIKCSADAIVTFNLRDFPADYLARYEIEVLHPDDFLVHQLGLNLANVLAAAQKCRERLKNPPRTADEWLDTLERQGLPQVVAELREFSAVI